MIGSSKEPLKPSYIHALQLKKGVPMHVPMINLLNEVLRSSAFRLLAAVLLASGMGTAGLALAATPAPVAESTYLDYSEADQPELYALWGKEGIERIKVMERKAVAHVALSPACNRIITVEPKSAKSTPPTVVVVSVVCDNGNRFYVGESELRKAPGELTYEKLF